MEDCIKVSEAGDGLIIRYYEFLGRAGEFNLCFCENPEIESVHVVEVNGLENSIEGGIEEDFNDLSNAEVLIPFKPFEIKSIKLKLKFKQDSSPK